MASSGVYSVLPELILEQLEIVAGKEGEIFQPDRSNLCCIQCFPPPCQSFLNFKPRLIKEPLLGLVNK